MTGYYSQADPESSRYEENPDLRLVCPECGEDVLISEYGEAYLCPGCAGDGSLDNLEARERLGFKFEYVEEKGEISAYYSDRQASRVLVARVFLYAVYMALSLVLGSLFYRVSPYRGSEVVAFLVLAGSILGGMFACWIDARLRRWTNSPFLKDGDLSQGILAEIQDQVSVIEGRLDYLEDKLSKIAEAVGVPD